MLRRAAAVERSAAQLAAAPGLVLLAGLLVLVAGASGSSPLSTPDAPWPCSNPQLGRHEGYEKPTYAWVPSIGISQLIVIEGSAFPFWKGDLMVSSLLAETLYRLRIEDGQGDLRRAYPDRPPHKGHRRNGWRYVRIRTRICSVPGSGVPVELAAAPSSVPASKSARRRSSPPARWSRRTC